MGRQNIYKTLNVALVMPQTMIEDVLSFLVTNTQYLLPSEKRSEAFKTRVSTHSVLSDIVHRLAILGKDQTFSLMRLPTKIITLREAVDMPFVPNDVLQMKAVTNTSSTSLSLNPNLNDKIVINVTDFVKQNGDFSDITQFHSRVVRDMLSRNFYLSGGNIWVNPALVRYVAKVYSMTIGARLARFFGLTTPEIQDFIRTVFCLFFVAKMTSPDVVQSFMKAHGKAMNFYASTDVLQVMAVTHDVLGKPAPDSLEDVFAVIDAYDHVQLKTGSGSRLSRPVLNVQFKSLCSDNHVSMIALEYPPYFLYLILLVLSNIRIGLSLSMKSMNLIKEGQEVVDTMLRSPGFFNDI